MGFAATCESPTTRHFGSRCGTPERWSPSTCSAHGATRIGGRVPIVPIGSSSGAAACRRWRRIWRRSEGVWGMGAFGVRGPSTRTWPLRVQIDQAKLSSGSRRRRHARCMRSPEFGAPLWLVFNHLAVPKRSRLPVAGRDGPRGGLLWRVRFLHREVTGRGLSRQNRPPLFQPGAAIQGPRDDAGREADFSSLRMKAPCLLLAPVRPSTTLPHEEFPPREELPGQRKRRRCA